MKEQVNLTRICDNCLIPNPEFRMTGVGATLQRICFQCGKNIGFTFKGKSEVNGRKKAKTKEGKK